MEVAINIVFVIFTNDGEVFCFDKFLNRRIDFAQINVWFYYAQRQVQVFLRDAVQTFVYDGRFIDDKYFRGIVVEIIFDYGDINVNDIVIFQQFSIVRDIVVYYFINRDVNGFRIVVIVEVGRNRVLFINNVIIIDAIQFVGVDVRFNIRFDYFQYFGSQSVSDAYFFDIFWGFD